MVQKPLFASIAVMTQSKLYDFLLKLVPERFSINKKNNMFHMLDSKLIRA